MMRSSFGLLSVLALGCSSAVPAEAPSEPPLQPVVRRTAVVLNWVPCTGEYLIGDECAVLDAPLLGDDMSRTVPVQIWHKRAKAAGAPQVWLLAGGPGQSATVLFPYLPSFQQMWGDADFYGIDHRGSGGDTAKGALRCDATTAEVCIEQLQNVWGKDGLGGFTSTQAALDVEQGILSTRKEGQKLFVLGGSYGTFWAQRFLQITQQQVDGVILDSLIKPVRSSARIGGIDFAAKKILEDCVAQDPLCAEKLGADPWKFAKDTIAAHRAGTLCRDLRMTTIRLQDGLGRLLRSDVTPYFLPAMLYKLSRCSEEDQGVIRKLDPGDIDPSNPQVRLALGTTAAMAQPLFYNVIFGEWFPTTDVTWKDVRQEAESHQFVFLGNAFSTVKGGAVWPRYARDEYVGKYYTGDVPILSLQGAYDSSATVEDARELAATFKAPGQTYVEFPYRTHIVIRDTTGCATSVIKQFVANPKGGIDASCVSQTKRMTFTDDAKMKSVFGVDATW